MNTIVTIPKGITPAAAMKGTGLEVIKDLAKVNIIAEGLKSYGII